MYNGVQNKNVIYTPALLPEAQLSLRILAKPVEDVSLDVSHRKDLDTITYTSPPSSEAIPFSEATMKNKNLFKIWNGNKKIYEIGTKEKIKAPGKLRTILKSLQYMNKKEKTILILSILAGAGTGFLAPFQVYLILTPLVTFFIKAEAPGNSFHLNKTAEIPIIMESGYSYFIVAAMNLIFGIFQIMGSEITSRNIMAKIKTAYLSKMLFMDVGWYDKSQEEFANTMSHNLQKMMALFDSKITSLAEMLSFSFFGCIAGLIISWKVALLTLGIMLIAMTVIYFMLQASKKRGNLRQKYNNKCSKIASEVLGNPRTVAAYGGEYKEIDRYKSTLKMSNKYGLKQATVIAAGKGFVYFKYCLCYLVAYYFSVRLYLVDDFNPGNIAIILIAQINAIYVSIYMLNIISDINMAADSAYEVMKYLDTLTNYSKSVKQGMEPTKFKANVSFRNVRFSYPTNLRTEVLHDLTLDIEPGKVTAIVGTSGAGKSTIVSLISRIYDVTAGEILIDGLDIQKLNVSWLRNQIGVVRQEPILFDTSIEENIRYGKTTATLEDIMEAAKISYAHDFIEKLPSGYDSIVGESGIKLSGGQKQRIAIARAIIRKPKLLLLDEATSALDFHSEGIVREALDNAMRGRTTLIIAHRMSTVKNADVIYAVKEGHVVEKGSHNELMELKGYYYSLAKFQEIDEKDKVVTLNQGNVPKEELIEEAIPFIDGNLETTQNEKNLDLNIKTLKLILVWSVAILFTIMASTFLPTFYYIFSQFCQSFTYTKDTLMQIALIDVGYLFGLGTIMFFSAILSGVMSTIGTQIWLRKLQQKAFNKLVSMDISWFDRTGNSPSECLEILTHSPLLIESVTGDKAAQVISAMLSIEFSIVYSLFVSPSTTLVNLPIFLFFIIINCLRLKSRDADARSASLVTRSTKLATEYVQNVKTIQTLNCQKYAINQYQDMLIHSKKEAIISICWYAAVYALSKTLMRLWLGITFIYGADDIASGNVQGTQLIGVIIALSLAANTVGPALTVTSQYPAARQAIKQLYRIAITKSSLNIMADQGIKPEISGNIVFQDLTFSYPTRKKVQVLKKLNLKIDAGMMVALIGDSGCGKSTIISLLERFYLPNEGKILIDGNNINDINVRYLRSQMGLVSQEPVLFDMTIKENILYGSEEEVAMDKIIAAAKLANIHKFIINLPQGYETLVGERGSKLSGGQKQRIAIARAVLRNPKILLLDEATSALDTESEKVVMEALENAWIGRTNIVIAHRLSTIRKADKIIVLQSGEVIEEGNHEQLMEKRGYYYKLLNR